MEVLQHINTRKTDPESEAKVFVEHIEIPEYKKLKKKKVAREIDVDFADVKGQESAKRGLEIAAAGGHNIIMYGPPGTGKTLIARNISKLITKKDPKIVNGPEIFNKFVGGSEQNIRDLFAEAEADYANLREHSPLHVIIFDEIDAICRHRGGKSDNTGTNDKVVNQLLTKIQGVDLIDNIFIIGLTNRLDLLDAALLRPGRLHPQIKIGLPDKKGREQVFNIHTKIMKSNGFVEDNVSFSELAKQTNNYTGAEIESIITTATSVALHRNINSGTEQVIVTKDDFTKSIEEFNPAFGNAHGKLGLIIKSMGSQPSYELNNMFNLKYISHIDSAETLVSSCIFNPDMLIGLLNVCYFDANTVKTISNSDLMGKSDGEKIGLITDAINECYQSSISTLLITDVDNLINYSKLGSYVAYSNSILQTLISVIKSESPFGNRIKIYLVVSNGLVKEFLSTYTNIIYDIDNSDISDDDDIPKKSKKK
jgi:vesicle-fusing ATPase